MARAVDIKMVIGDILQAEEQVPHGIDLAFVDGNKRDYLAYYEFLLPRLSPGGCMLADNTLWDGHVLESDREDAQTQGIRAFNDRVAADERVETLILRCATASLSFANSRNRDHRPRFPHKTQQWKQPANRKSPASSQKELSEIFLLQTKAMHGVLVSVSKTYISPDMSICRAYLSVFPSERSEEIVRNINANAATLRFELGKRVRHQLRIIPELKFFIDDSLDYAENIDRLLKL